MLWLLAVPVVLLIIAAVAMVGFYWYTARQLEEGLEEVQDALTEVREGLALEYRLFDDLTDVAESYMKHQREELDRLGELSPDVGSTVKELKNSRERMLALKIDFLGSVQDYPELVEDSEFQEILGKLEEARSRRERRIQEYEDAAREYNDLVRGFPTRYVAQWEDYSWVRSF